LPDLLKHCADNGIVLERRRVTATALFIASFVRRHHFGGWRQVDTLSLSPLSITRIATVGNVLDSRHLLARFPAPLYVGMEIYNSAVLWHCRELGGWTYGSSNRRRGLDCTASTKLVSAAGCFRLFRNAYYRVFHSRDRRVVWCEHIEAMGVHRENADVAGAQYRPYPDCADALSSPADIPHSGCFRIKKNVEIVAVNFILDVSCLMVS
jgi:hypothetical protein